MTNDVNVLKTARRSKFDIDPAFARLATTPFSGLMISLNLYVGPLCRYYTGRWETIAQRTARKRNLTIVSKMTGDAAKLTRVKPSAVRPRIIAWRARLNRQYGDVLPELLDWPEQLTGTYFTDKPDMHGYGGLNLWAAYLETSHPGRPEKMPSAWRENAAYLAARAPGRDTMFKNILRETVFWLPVMFDLKFQAKDPRGRSMNFGSSPALLNELEVINERSWKADPSMVERWGLEGAPEDAGLERCAKYAFAVFHKMAAASVEHKLPMLLHLT